MHADDAMPGSATARLVVIAALTVLLGSVLAPKPAVAHSNVRVGVGVGVGVGGYYGYRPYGYPPYYYPPRYYYYPPPYYYYPPPPPPVIYVPVPTPAPAPPATSPPVPAATQTDCRDYESTMVIDGRSQKVVGTACRQPDGTWRIVR